MTAPAPADRTDPPTADRRAVRLSPQLLALLGGLLLWSAWPEPALWALLAGYLAAWGLLNWTLPRRIKAGGLALPLTRSGAALLVALLLAPPAAALWRHGEALVAAEGLVGLGAWSADRGRLEGLPAISPPVLFDDHPQSFYVYAPDARPPGRLPGAPGAAVRARFDAPAPGGGAALIPGPELPAVDLGQGLYRIDYDPRLHGAIPVAPLPEGAAGAPGDPPAAGSDRVTVRLTAGPATVMRRLSRVRPAAHPRWLRSAPAAGLAVAVSEETDELFVIGRGGLVDRRPVADGPTDALPFAGGRLVAVAHRYGDELLVLATAAEAGAAGADGAGGGAGSKLPVQRLPLGPFQQRLARRGDRLAVALAGLDPAVALLRIAPEWQAGGGAGAGDPERSPLSLEEVVPLPFAPDWIAFGDDPDLLVLSDRTGGALHRLERLAGPGGKSGGDPGGDPSWRLTGRLELGRPAVTLAAVAGPGGALGGRIAVAVTGYQRDGVAHRGNHFIQDQLLLVDPRRWRIDGRRLTGRRSAVQDRPGDLDSGLSPLALGPAADGGLLVAFAGSDEVWRLPASESAGGGVVGGVLVGGVGVGGEPVWTLGGYDLELVAPHGVADLGEGYWAATSAAGGCLAVFYETELVAFDGVAPSDDELAAAPEGSLARLQLDLRAGERAFYEATRAGISCQSCHLHGTSDESRHDIGQAPLLPTLTVAGVAGTAPYLRDGSFPRVRELDRHLAGELYRGYRRFEPGRGELLERYVESLPRPVNPRLIARLAGERAGGRVAAGPESLLDRPLDRQRAGAAAFVAARCTLCHSFPAFTNLSQHPAASLFPDYAAGLAPAARLDTPGLLALHARGHLLQDGRAHDLAEVLGEHNRANLHGDSASLSDGERAALIEFLESL